MNAKKDILPDMVRVMVQVMEVTTRLEDSAVLDSYGMFAGSTGRTSGMSEEDAHLNAAANYIRSGHYKEALNVLDGISQHSARWYFYSASANSGLGNNVTALEHARESSSSGATEYAVSDVASTAGMWRKLVSDKTDDVRISGNL